MVVKGRAMSGGVVVGERAGLFRRGNVEMELGRWLEGQRKAAAWGSLAIHT